MFDRVVTRLVWVVAAIALAAIGVVKRVMDRFAGSLRHQVDSDEVVRGWVGVVSETMQPTAVSVWVRGES